MTFILQISVALTCENVYQAPIAHSSAPREHTRKGWAQHRVACVPLASTLNSKAKNRQTRAVPAQATPILALAAGN
jgi:hypothetical protein